MKKLTILGVCVSLLPLAAFAFAPTAPPGPKAIEDMLRGMFQAIDSGDHAGCKACIATADCPFPVLTWDLDLEGKPVAIQGAEATCRYIDGLFDSIAKSNAKVASKITAMHAECAAPELGYATIEVSQSMTVDGKSEVSNFRATALCNTDKQGKWRVFHWHASPTAAASPAPAPTPTPGGHGK